MITAVVYGRENCGICKSAAEKLERLNISYTKEDIDRFIQLHDGWQADGSVEVMAAMCEQNQHIPIIRLNLDNGDVKYLSYAAAMAVLKDETRKA